jgi:DNA-binding NarL/FixJ family response regulator
MTDVANDSPPSPMPATVHVVIVEDNHDIRESLAALIDDSEGFVCSGAFASAEAALEGIASVTVDVVLMDIQLPQMSGIECISHLQAMGMNAPIMILSIYDDYDTIFQSLVAGAVGYVLKNTPPERLVEAIGDVIQGGSPMSSQIARKVIKAFQTLGAAPKETDNLSHREVEILRFIADGYSDKQIADKIFLSFQTVRKHVANIYKKLHVRSRTQATATYRRNFPSV